MLEKFVTARGICNTLKLCFSTSLNEKNNSFASHKTHKNYSPIRNISPTGWVQQSVGLKLRKKRGASNAPDENPIRGSLAAIKRETSWTGAFSFALIFILRVRIHILHINYITVIKQTRIQIFVHLHNAQRKCVGVFMMCSR